MTLRRLVLPGILLGVCALAAPAAAGSIAWRQGVPFAEAVAEAEASGRPILVDVFTDWCGPCRMLDRDVWTDARIVSLVEDGFVPVKVDAEKGEGVAVAGRYKVFAYPNILVLNPDGTERDRFIGYQPADGMLTFLEDMKAGRNTADVLMRETPATSMDVERVFTVGERLAAQARTVDATPYLERTLALDPDNARGFAVRALLVRADLARKDGDFDGAVAFAERVLDDFDDEAAKDEALSSIAYYRRKQGDVAGAADAYRRMMERHPDDPGTLNAFAWFAATNGTALVEATAAAEKAATLSGDDPGVLDTLAETYYARGLYDDALATIARALVKSPGDDYLLGQEAKFRAAKTGKR